MAEKSKGKRIPLQPGGRMLLGLSDEIHAMPYEDKGKVLTDVSALPALYDFFMMLPTMKDHLQKKGFRGIYEEFANGSLPIPYERPKDDFAVENIEDEVDDATDESRAPTRSRGGGRSARSDRGEGVGDAQVTKLTHQQLIKLKRDNQLIDAKEDEDREQRKFVIEWILERVPEKIQRRVMDLHASVFRDHEIHKVHAIFVEAYSFFMKLSESDKAIVIEQRRAKYRCEYVTRVEQIRPKVNEHDVIASMAKALNQPDITFDNLLTDTILSVRGQQLEEAVNAIRTQDKQLKQLQAKNAAPELIAFQRLLMPSNVNELIEFFEQFEYNVTEDTFVGSWYMGKEEGKAKKKTCKYCEKDGHYLFKTLKSTDVTCPKAKKHVELKKRYGTDTRKHIVDQLAKYNIKA